MSSFFSSLGLSSLGSSIFSVGTSVVVGGALAAGLTAGVTQTQKTEAPANPPAQEQLFSYSQ